MWRRKAILWIGVPLLAGATAFGYRSGAFNDVLGTRALGYNQPVLETPGPIDLGDQELGAILIPRFAVGNSGTEQLFIDDVRNGSCACAGLERESDGNYTRVETLRLNPGERVELVMRLSVRGRIGEPMRNLIRFRTNDPNRPEGQFEVVVSRVTGGVITEPASLVFGTVVTGNSTRKLLKVWDAASVPRRIKNVLSSAPERFSVRLLPQGDGEDGDTGDHGRDTLLGVVEVTLHARYAGPIDGEVLVCLDEASRPPGRVPLIGRVAEIVEAIPAAIVLPRSSQNGPIYTAECLVHSNTDGLLSLKVESVPPGLTVKIDPPRGQSRTRLVRIEWNPSSNHSSPAQMGLHVRLRADVGDLRRFVDIPVVVHQVGD